MRCVLRRAFLGLVAVSLVAGWTVLSSQAQQPAPPAVSFEKSNLVIDTAGGPLTFEVELALTPDQQQRGLMFRQKLGAKEGMLFDFGSPQPLSFWMANTLIPLDMLFIDGEGKIVRVHANAEPLSTRAITSGVPARAVLEINGGASRLLGIKPGDVVRHALFGNEK